MSIQKKFSKITLSILVAFSTNMTSAADFFNDFSTEVANATSPADVISFIDRRINEWSIGVFDPDYGYPFAIQNYSKRNSHYEFSNVVTFGDSLSDRGTRSRSTMFLAGGYSNKLYNDYLSEHYSGKSSAPYTLGGLNYAEAGATFKNRGTDVNLNSQIDKYLARNSNRADPNALFIISAGGMDINKSLNKIIAGYVTGDYSFNDPFYTIDDSPHQAALQTQRLFDAGAKYIIITNVPDASLAPYTPLFPIEQITSILSRFYLPDFGLVTHVGQLLDNYLRNPANQIPGTGREMIRLNGINSLSKILWFLPPSFNTSLYDFLVRFQKNPTRQFNQSLELELSQVKGNIVFVDIDKLIYEVIEDYRKYGIDDILVPTCTLGFSSRYCDIDSKHYHNDKVYLFGDWFHPSAETHFAINQYIQSVFDAPVLISSISEHFANINLAKNTFLESQLFSIQREIEKTNKQWTSFVGYSGLLNDTNYSRNHQLSSNKTYVHNLNLGFYTATTPELTLGVMFTTSLGKQKPFDSFNYRFASQSITLFSQWVDPNGLWLNAALDFGYSKVKNINRLIQIGQANIQEKPSSTNMFSIGANVKGGYDLINREGFQSGPILGLSINQINVKSLREEGNRSTSMHFDSHNKNDFFATIGWYINTKDYMIANRPSHFKADINYNHTLGSEKTKITGALNSTATSFTREIINPKQWLQLNASMNVKTGESSTVYANTGFFIDNKKTKKLNYGIGFNHKF